MSRIVKKWPLSPANEIIWMGFVGMGLTAIEESCVDLQQSFYYIWTQTFPYDSFSEETQEIIKSVLSGIVLVRSLTVHLYFFSYFAMLMMVIFEEMPILSLPWLAVSMIRNFLLDTLAFLTGIFICIRYKLAPVCYEFMLYKICEMGVSIYLWVSVLKLSQDISFPDMSGGDLVLSRAECVPRRAKEQEVAEAFVVTQKDYVQAGLEGEDEEEGEEEDEEEEEEEGQEEELYEVVPELEVDEGEISASEDEGVQVSTLSRKFLKQAAQELGNAPDEVDDDPECQCVDNPLEQTTGDEDQGIKSAGTQVNMLSKQFLAQAEESASKNKWNVEIQVNTVSYEFLSQEAEKLGLASDRGFRIVPLVPP